MEARRSKLVDEIYQRAMAMNIVCSINATGVSSIFRLNDLVDFDIANDSVVTVNVAYNPDKSITCDYGSAAEKIVRFYLQHKTVGSEIHLWHALEKICDLLEHSNFITPSTARPRS